MRQKSVPVKEPATQVVKNIRRATRRHFSAEDKIRIVLEGLRGEDSIAELCRREGIVQNLYYRWSKDGCWHLASFAAVHKIATRSEVQRTWTGPRPRLPSTKMTLMYGSAVRCKRFCRSWRCGLASMYPASDWSVYSRPSWISARMRPD
jgi:transposase